MRNWTFGAKALSIRPPATITPLKMVTGRAPKLSTQALQIGPEGEGREESQRKIQKNVSQRNKYIKLIKHYKVCAALSYSFEGFLRKENSSH